MYFLTYARRKHFLKDIGKLEVIQGLLSHRIGLLYPSNISAKMES